MASWGQFPKSAIALTLLAAMASGGCWFGPKSLELSHGKYNSAVNRVVDEQLLLNLVRLRYNDTLTQLDISSIAAQYELDGSLEARPFFSTEGVNLNPPVGPFGAFSRVLPFAGVSATNRPTFSLNPLDDPETLHSLFAVSTLDSIIFFSETSWPVSTVFRLWVESMNRLPNAPSASGPDLGLGTEFRAYRRVTDLLQQLQDARQIRFLRAEKLTEVGSPLPADAVTAAHQVEAAKQNMEYRQREDKKWVLIRRDRKLALHIDPKVVNSPQVHELRSLLNLTDGRLEYELRIGQTDEPFARTDPPTPTDVIHIVPRSTIQVLFYAAHGVEVPPEHYCDRLVKPATDATGQPFDWSEVTERLFTVHVCAKKCRPECAFVAVHYRGYWYYIDDHDADTKTTFSFLIAMTRLNAVGSKKGGPALTLPVGR